MVEYADHVRQSMKRLYDSLAEKDRRRYAAVEAEKICHGGVAYIARLLGIDEKQYGSAAPTWNCYRRTPPDRGSEKKGGRPRIASISDPHVEDCFFEIISYHTAGDPMDEDLCLTYLSGAELASSIMYVTRR